MHVNKPKLYFENVSYLIEKITYRSLKAVEEGKELTVKISDTFKPNEVNTKVIEITVNRSVNFKPKSLYSLSIEVRLNMQLNQTDKKYSGTSKELQDYVQEHYDTIINRSNLMETVSLLISQITSSYGQVPIITPPTFIVET